MRMAPRVCRVENSSIHGKSSRRFIRNEIEADYLSGFGGIASDRSPRVGGEAYFMEWTAGMTRRPPCGGHTDWLAFSENR